MNNDPPLILIPGMGADGRIFRAQRAVFPQLFVPTWLDPIRNETLVAYARRFAKAIDPRRPCFVGGASFGGVVALEMAAHLNTLGVFLIGSARSPSAMAWPVRAVRPLARLALALPFPLVSSMANMSLRSSGRRSSIATRGLLMQVADADATFLRWGTRAILSWQPSSTAGHVPIHQIHGEKDRVFPARLSQADVIIPGAGHLLSVTHGGEVNRFIAARMRF